MREAVIERNHLSVIEGDLPRQFTAIPPFVKQLCSICFDSLERAMSMPPSDLCEHHIVVSDPSRLFRWVN
jgi:hypothetical protein